MEATICMECSVSIVSSGRQSKELFIPLPPPHHTLLSGIIGSLFLTLWSLGIALLLAGTNSAPLGQFCLGTLVPFSQLFLPHLFQPFGANDFGSTFVELLSVAVGTGVCPPFVF